MPGELMPPAVLPTAKAKAVLLIEDDSDKLVVGMGGYGDESTRKVLLELGDVQIEESDDGDLRAITALTRPQIDALADYESA